MTGRSLEREVADLTHAINDPEHGLTPKVDRASTRSRMLLRWVKVLVGVVAVAVAVGGIAIYAFVHQHNEDQAKARERRRADCESIADFGDLVKQPITVISVPPDREAQLDAFVQQYDAAVDAGVVKIRVHKGYSADCSVIGNPPKAGG